ncbi:hypothetical protein [Spiroplasma endosymbiont of Nebria brevicollis]|uniref:hypothetical protein n=1 Tax=Spiroplasma endosymbiont of Nebria brevicollis TaxID=3066284 RepID=UPI00313D9883
MELWLADVIIVSTIIGIILLTIIACKGHDLCHRNKPLGLIFMFISLNIFGFIWGILILGNEKTITKNKEKVITPQ